ncbi:alpha/beta fold hydrolase [Rummeliibacillus sp. NPDC094406]|uniref:alpha/beta fold hydrolase n=1 Tax=Rummeliibacillus sp. NPDC094406 TaxID=3364511 RepID=UPI00380C104E
MIEVNDHQIHIYKNEKKSEPKPTIVLTSGSGTTTPFADFYPLYIKLDINMHFALYERPGYGWSEDTSSSRDIDTVVKELRELLQKSQEKPPYIFIGHSMGTLEIIRYAQLYPEEVKALVMIDGISPQYAKNYQLGKSQYLGWIALKGLRDFGIMNLLAKTGAMDSLFIDIDGLPQEIQNLKVNMALKNMNNPNMKEELEQMSENGETILSSGTIGAIPILIFSATNNGYDHWEKTQQELLSISTHSKQIIFENTNHYIHHEKSKEIAKELKQFLTDLEK